jgi:hypothetical protein
MLLSYFPPSPRVLAIELLFILCVFLVDCLFQFESLGFGASDTIFETTPEVVASYDAAFSTGLARYRSVLRIGHRSFVGGATCESGYNYSEGRNDEFMLHNLVSFH